MGQARGAHERGVSGAGRGDDQAVPGARRVEPGRARVADRDEPADGVAVGGRAAGHHLRPVVSGGGDVGDSDARVARLAVLQYGGGISVTDRGLFPGNDGVIALIVGVVVLAAVVVSSGAVALAVMAAQAVR